MMKRLFLYSVLIFAAFTACSDDDSFTTSRSALLTFSRDTVSLDTVFSAEPSSTYTFWAYNKNDEGLRLRQVRLQRGNQSGYRVNVDGIYLDNSLGSTVNDIEIRKGDSIRVFVELTSVKTNSDRPEEVKDDIVFTLESGVEQKVTLCAYSWDAITYDSIIVSNDTIINSLKPIVVKKGIKVEEGSTLIINAPSKLYFHSGAGIDVYGSLLVNPDSPDAADVVFRGDRLDRMFDYLPYDRVSGQWKGITFHSSSNNNYLLNADIHSSEHGIVCDSAEFDTGSLRLSLENVTIHNCKGPGLISYNSNISLVNSQFSNTLGDCVAIYGGRALIMYCTLAQFYPFSGNRGVALRFTNFYEDKDFPLYLECYNSIITGYSDDEFMGVTRDEDSEIPFVYYFYNSIMRTPKTEDMEQDEGEHFVSVIFEKADDEIQGKNHFACIDEDNLYYDFHLDSLSTAIGAGIAITQYPYDHDKNIRGDKPDIGCYQYR